MNVRLDCFYTLSHYQPLVDSIAHSTGLWAISTARTKRFATTENEESGSSKLAEALLEFPKPPTVDLLVAFLVSSVKNL